MQITSVNSNYNQSSPAFGMNLRLAGELKRAHRDNKLDANTKMHIANLKKYFNELSSKDCVYMDVEKTKKPTLVLASSIFSNVKNNSKKVVEEFLLVFTNPKQPGRRVAYGMKNIFGPNSRRLGVEDLNFKLETDDYKECVGFVDGFFNIEKFLK